MNFVRRILGEFLDVIEWSLDSVLENDVIEFLITSGAGLETAVGNDGIDTTELKNAINEQDFKDAREALRLFADADADEDVDDLAALVDALNSLDRLIRPFYDFIETIVVTADDGLTEDEAIELATASVNFLFSSLFVARLRQVRPELYNTLIAAGIIDDGVANYESARVLYFGLKHLFGGEILWNDPMWYLGLAAVIALHKTDRIDEDHVRVLYGWEPNAFKEVREEGADEDSPPDQQSQIPSHFPTEDRILRRALSLDLGTTADAGDLDFPLKAIVSALVVKDADPIEAAEDGFYIIPADYDDGSAKGLLLSLGGEIGIDIPIKDMTLKISLAAPDAGQFFIDGKDWQDFGNKDADLEAKLVPSKELLGPKPRLPLGGDSFLLLGYTGVGLRMKDGRFSLKTELKDTEIFLRPSDSALLNFILPDDGIHATFNLGLAINFAQNTVSLSEGTSLRIVIPIGGDEIGGIRVQYLTLETVVEEGESFRTRTEISATFIARWSKVELSVERMGAELYLPRRPDDDDHSGLSRLLDFCRPTGIGFSIRGDNESWVSGGGFLFFDPDRDECGGMVTLNLGKNRKVNLTVFGLIRSDIPQAPNLDEKSGSTSTVLIGSVSWSPGPPVGLPGTTLTGLGLLFLHNASIDVDALRRSVRTGAINHLLFPEDPIANATRILNDVRTLFPAHKGRQGLGLLVRLTYGATKNDDKAVAKVAIALEWPTPVVFAVFGSIEIGIPTRKAKTRAARINADFAVIWDQADDLISMDASLRDSYVAASWTMVGDLAMRIRYSDPKVFVLAVGGFHPDYDANTRLPAEAKMPELRRVTIALGSSKNPRIRALGYFALASGMAMAGVRAEVHASKGSFSLEGWVSVDVILELWGIRVDFSAGVKIKKGSRNLFTLSLDGSLECFYPVRIKARVKFKILFFTVKIPVKFSIGKDIEVSIEAVNLSPQLESSLSEPAAWTPELPPDIAHSPASLAREPGDKIFVHPAATLRVSQELLPLGIDVERYHNAVPSGETRFEVAGLQIEGQDVSIKPVRDDFAVAQYVEMSDAEKLSRPAFEKLISGVEADEQNYSVGSPVDTPMEYETIIVDQSNDVTAKLFGYHIIDGFLPGALAHSSAAIQRRGGTPTERFAGSYNFHVHAVRAGYIVADRANLAVNQHMTPTPMTYTEAAQTVAAHERANPADGGRFQVVSIEEAVQDE